MPDFSGSLIDHLNLPVTDLAASVAFYEAAVAAGATTLRPPGEYPEYHPGYYGAFVADPDGINVEAVCHGATGSD